MTGGVVIVTGGSGNLGSHTIKDLQASGYDVLNVDMVEPREKYCDFWKCDLAQLGELCDIFSEADTVIHLAGYQSPDMAADTEILRNNVIASYNVLKAAAETNVRRVVMGSSVAAYGFLYAPAMWPPDYLPLDEDHPCIPKDPYAMSKVFGERLVTSFVAQKKFSAVSLRFSGINFDPGFLTLPERWVNPRAKMGTFWSYVDVRDAGLAIKLAVEADLRGHEVLNIAAHKSRYLEPTTELVRRYLPGTRIKPGVTGRWSGLDSSRAQSVLGFQARHVWENYLHRDGTPISN